MVDISWPAPSPSEPLLHRRATGEPCRLPPKQLGDRQAGLARPSPERGVDLVVEVSDLDGFRHRPEIIMRLRMWSCVGASPALIWDSGAGRAGLEPSSDGGQQGLGEDADRDEEGGNDELSCWL